MMKKVILGLYICVLIWAACVGCSRGDSSQKTGNAPAEKASENRQGNDEKKDADYEVKILPMSEDEQRKASDKLLALAEICRPIFERADKGGGLNVTLEEAAVHEMADAAAAKGFPVTCGGHDYDMRNYEKAHENLKKAQAAKDGEAEIYVVDANGLFRYYCFQFKKGKMGIVSAVAAIDETEGIVVQQLEKIQPCDWEYTEKGWLIWEKALSRNHEMDMHVFCRILPLDEKCREVTEKYIAPIGYVSNNLFLTDWDGENMQRIAFNDLFDALYGMENGSALEADRYREGIPKEEFEDVVLRHFDMTAQQLWQYAAFDQEKGIYPWTAAGPRNRVQRTRPFPEAVQCVDNGDGTISVRVEAVFIEIGKDCAFSHIVNMREEDGKWVYLGNKIHWEDSYTVPSYKARKDYGDYPF